MAVLPFIFKRWFVEEAPIWTGVYPISCGEQNLIRLYGRIAPNYCLHFVLNGSVLYQFNRGPEVHLSRGDMFLSWRGFPFKYSSASPLNPEETKVCWVHLKGPMVIMFLEAMGFSLERTWLRAREPERVEAAFSKMLDMATRNPHILDMEVISILYELAAGCGGTRTPQVQKISIAKRVREFMESEVDSGLNIQQISEVFHISPSTLFLHFKREYGKSPLQVLTEIRMEHAKHLLKETDLSVAEVASAVGFIYPFYFIRKFHNIVGTSPGEYRKPSR